jgi:hypothetical protein
MGEEQRETKNQTCDLDVTEITPSTLDENPGASKAIYTGSEKRLQILDNVVSGRRRVFNF